MQIRVYQLKVLGALLIRALGWLIGAGIGRIRTIYFWGSVAVPMFVAVTGVSPRTPHTPKLPAGAQPRFCFYAFSQAA